MHSHTYTHARTHSHTHTHTHTHTLTRLHAICVCDNADFFYHRIDEELQGYGLTTDKDGKPLNARDLVNIVDGYKGKGYAMNTEEELGKNWVQNH